MNLRELRHKIEIKAVTSGSRYGRKLFKWLDLLISDYANLQAVGLWAAAIVTGLLAVAYAYAFRFIETRFEHFITAYPWAVFAATPLLFTLAWWLVYRFAPEASGSGIPQVMAAIELEYKDDNTKFVDRLLSIKTATIKILSSLLCLAGGGAIGREGPTLQISAVVFHSIGKFVRRLYPDSHEQTWVIAGAAAGLASAFNTPLGGIVYAIEELGMKHFHRVRTALLSAVIISGLVAQGLFGSYLYLGYPQLKPISLHGWPLVILTGFIAGLGGALFSQILLKALQFRRRLKNPWQLGTFAMICGLIAAMLIFFDNANSGSGGPLISRILFTGESGSFSLSLGRVFATCAAYLSGAAGGIFSPSLTIGAALGSKLAFTFENPQINFFAMLGMIGFLTGVTHTPFTSFILVMEMSDRHSAIFPMMVVALIANSTAKSISSSSFYESVRDSWLKQNTHEP
ncbi:MAG: chloride channel protein [Bdellovibrionota bacterium]